MKRYKIEPNKNSKNSTKVILLQRILLQLAVFAAETLIQNFVKSFETKKKMSYIFINYV